MVDTIFSDIKASPSIFTRVYISIVHYVRVHSKIVSNSTTSTYANNTLGRISVLFR